MTTYTPFTSANLRALIVSTLTPLGLWTANAEEILVATCAQESHMGLYRTQIKGPARGIFQMEGGDFTDIHNNYLKYHSALSANIIALNNNVIGQADDLITNDKYAIALARVHYMRLPKALPAPTDLAGLWLTYKVGYNSVNGAATQEQFYANYKHFITDGKAS